MLADTFLTHLILQITQKEIHTMGIQRNITGTITCDDCRTPIQFPQNEKLVNMGSYGLTLHIECFTAISGARLLEIMGEDETTLYTLISAENATAEDAVRLRRPTNLKANGTVTGQTELVQWEL